MLLSLGHSSPVTRLPRVIFFGHYSPLDILPRSRLSPVIFPVTIDPGTFYIPPVTTSSGHFPLDIFPSYATSWGHYTRSLFPLGHSSLVTAFSVQSFSPVTFFLDILYSTGNDYIRSFSPSLLTLGHSSRGHDSFFTIVIINNHVLIVARLLE